MNVKVFIGKGFWLLTIYLLIIFSTGCNVIYVEKERKDRNLVKNNINCSVAEIWQDVASEHELLEENIIFTESLLKDINVGTHVLSKKNQTRLRKSLHLYLTQFSSRFMKGDQDAKVYAKDYCYATTWFISQGVKRKQLDKEKEMITKDTYRIFFDELILEANIRILKIYGVEIYTKYAKTISQSSKQTKDTLLSYYHILSDDFLYPSFKEPLKEKVKVELINNSLKIAQVPAIYDSPPEYQNIDEDFYTGMIKIYFEQLAIFPAYKLTCKSIRKEIFKTEEWGHMSFNTENREPAEGKWPLLLRFRPDDLMNKATKENPCNQQNINEARMGFAHPDIN